VYVTSGRMRPTVTGTTGCSYLMENSEE